jgi:tartrate-resistant acid phosphatase type 5
MRSRVSHRRLLLAAVIVVLPVATCLLAPPSNEHRPHPLPGSADASGAMAPSAPICKEPHDAGSADAGTADTVGDRLLTRFAVIGDYGINSEGERSVATMIKGWRPEFVITTGDNNYPSGAADTIDVNIGQFFHELIGGYFGRFGCGAETNRFFPALGNHDLYTGAGRPYFDYFQLPGNERYYDFVRGSVHLFAIDSDGSEPDGNTADSKQAAWLRDTLATSTTRWQVVYMHHPPYSSSSHGSTVELQWPYAQWGADLVLAGHDHSYERIDANGITYIVNGLGGAENYPIVSPVAGSRFSYSGGFGALLVDANATVMHLRFYGVNGQLLDDTTLGAPTVPSP